MYFMLCIAYIEHQHGLLNENLIVTPPSALQVQASETLGFITVGMGSLQSASSGVQGLPSLSS
jgi:hypothetical protein